MWFKLADRQNWSITEAKQKVTSSEFKMWQAYFEFEANQFTPDRQYLAQIARQVATVLMKDPSSVKIDDFHLEFEFKPKEKEQPIVSNDDEEYFDDEERDDDGLTSAERLQMQKSKMYWFTLVQAGSKKNLGIKKEEREIKP